MPPQITPVGWRCSDKTRRRAEKKLPLLQDIIRCKVEKFKRIPGIDVEELEQEAQLAAVYAIDKWDRAKGKGLRGYVDLVVRNALLAIVNWEKALKRHPRQDGGRRVAKKERLLCIFADADAAHGVQEDLNELLDRAMEEEAREVEAILALLDEDEQEIIRTKLNPPPELLLAARNIRPRRPRITNRLVAAYLEIPVTRVREALQSARYVWEVSERDF